jgi:prepilin-type processing-associated H-X9-DG protein
VTYSTCGALVPGAGNENTRPFGYPAGGSTPISGAPFLPLKITGITQYTNNLSGCYALRDVDQEIDQGTPPAWHGQIAPKAVHGNNLRNVIYFDWHAQAIKGTNFLN